MVFDNIISKKEQDGKILPQEKEHTMEEGKVTSRQVKNKRK